MSRYSHDQLSIFATPARQTLPEQTRESKGRYPSVPIYRVSLVRESAIPVDRPQLRSSNAAGRLLRDYLGETDREHFVVMLLDRKNKVIGLNTVSIGSLTASVVHPREVSKPAILANAAAMICGHNHPSGVPRSTYVESIQ
jgi:DNA repair protein RadC